LYSVFYKYYSIYDLRDKTDNDEKMHASHNTVYYTSHSLIRINISDKQLN